MYAADHMDKVTQDSGVVQGRTLGPNENNYLKGDYAFHVRANSVKYVGLRNRPM